MKKETITKDRPLGFYLNLNYPITFYPEDDGGFTVVIKDLPGCMTQGDTAEEAFEMIVEARELWIESAYEDGDPIPMPSTETTYSGKTMLRMPKSLHRKLAESAKRQDVSLNQYIVSLLSERNALKVVDEVRSQLNEIRQQSKREEPSAYWVGEGQA